MRFSSELTGIHVPWADTVSTPLMADRDGALTSLLVVADNIVFDHGCRGQSSWDMLGYAHPRSHRAYTAMAYTRVYAGDEVSGWASFVENSVVLAMEGPQQTERRVRKGMPIVRRSPGVPRFEWRSL